MKQINWTAVIDTAPLNSHIAEVSSFGVLQGSVVGLPFLYTPISIKVASERNDA